MTGRTVSRVLRAKVRRRTSRFIIRRKKNAAALIGLAFLILILLILIILLTGGLGIREEDVSELKIPFDSVSAIHSLSERFGLAFDELLALYMAENMFFPERLTEQDENSIERRYILGYNELTDKYGDRLDPYREVIRLGLNEIKIFPVAGEPSDYIYGDSFTINDRHTGIDIYDRENLPGRLPVLSVSDGFVEETGQDRTNGIYIKVRTDEGSELSYQRLHEINENIAEGLRVSAGQPLGLLGDTGSGCDSGGISVGLHVGYRVDTEEWGEIWLNPYMFLRLVENSLLEKTLKENLEEEIDNTIYDTLIGDTYGKYQLG